MQFSTSPENRVTSNAAFWTGTNRSASLLRHGDSPCGARPLRYGCDSRHRVQVDQQRVVIGRGTGADVRLPKGTVSEHHATIRLDPNGFVLVDESSTNGTYVDGVRLVPGRAKSLREGDVIRVSTFSSLSKRPPCQSIRCRR
ncbi:MAG: FHA domain-containing protein [Sandaracinaceae bacterium]|nr:FHA domain-containing protein [Sandaracinaceae bacterium]